MLITAAPSERTMRRNASNKILNNIDKISYAM